MKAVEWYVEAADRGLGKALHWYQLAEEHGYDIGGRLERLKYLRIEEHI
jgi:TPR repeat protein